MPQATGLVLYFEKTYVGRKFPGGGYEDPLFPIEMWNYHYDTEFGLLIQLNALSMLLLAVNIQIVYHCLEA